MAIRVLAAALAAAAVFGAGAALAFQDEHGALPGGGGAALFETKCKTCHDPAVDRAPDRAALRQRTPEQVVQALTRGSMTPMAAGLTPAMVSEIAEFVTGKKLAASTAGQSPLQAGVQPPDNRCTAKAPPIKVAATDWNGWGKSPSGARYQPATTITPANVERLKVKWAFSMAGGRTGQPTVVGDWMFFGTFAGDFYALDARTGCVRWHKSGVGPVRTSAVVEHRPGASKSGWVVYFGDHVRDFWALDAETGEQLWKLNLDSHPLAMLTGSPVIHGDILYQPISSSEENMGATATYSCCTFAGKVVAIDLKTHKILWKTALLDPKPSRKNTAGVQLYGPAGAGIWDQPTIDARRGQLYVTTGDSYTEVEETMSDAIVAIGLTDGKVRWHTQVTAKDAFLIGCPRGVNCPLGTLGPDYDFGASPILANLPGGKQIILAGQKSGLTYGVDPDTGKVVWQQRVGAGSALGGVEWGMAYDGKRLYAAASDAAARENPKPGITAVDPATGKIVWQTPAPKVPCGWTTRRCVNAQSAATTAVPGLVFQGGHDGWLRAYLADSGRTAWLFDSAGRTYASVNGVPNQPGGSFDHSGPVVSGGTLYAISGYNGATGAYGNPLNVLLAFTVDGK